MKKVISLLFVLLMFSFKHPHYVSVTELKYNEKEKMLQGTVKLFVNDFEDALRRLTKEKVDLIHPKDVNKTNKMVADYLRDRLIMSIYLLPVSYKVLGFEHEQESIYIYFESRCEFPKKIYIENTILYDFLKEQTNIVHMEVNGKKQSSKVTNPEKEIRFEFK